MLHDAKIEALKEIVEASNEPVLIAYNFQSDAERICKAIKGAVVLKKDAALIDKWNKGRCRSCLRTRPVQGTG